MTTTNNERIADLVWFPRRQRWRVKPMGEGGGYMTDIRYQPLSYKTIESARAALEGRGYTLGEIRGYDNNTNERG